MPVRRASSVESPSDEPDPVIEAYKTGIDRTLIAENLRRTPEERLGPGAGEVIDIEEALRVLTQGQVEFIVAGGSTGTSRP